MTKATLPLRIFGYCVVFFLMLPTLVIVPMSFSSGRTLKFPPPGYSTKWYENLATNSTWTDAAKTSFQVGVFAALFATILGTLAALAFARGEFPGKSLLYAVVLSPMIIPLVIIGIGMFSIFVRWNIDGSLASLVIAHTVLGIPFVVINVLASLRTVDPNLELAAANLGAGPVRTFQQITLPLIAPGAIAGAVFAFITSWDEVVVALFLSSPTQRTLPIVMWGQVRTSVDPTIAAAATLLTGLTVLVVVLSSFVRARGATQI